MKQGSSPNLHICLAVHADITHAQRLAGESLMPLYKDVISALYNCPKLPFTVHISGSFLESCQADNNILCTIINDMRKRKQVEIVGSGYYQPFFSLLPVSDGVDHIETMTNMLRKYFDRRQRGLYLSHSCWDPNFIPLLKKCGIDYCLLDRRLIIGQPHLNSLAPICVEDSGKTVTVLPFENLAEEFHGMSPEEFYQYIIHKNEGVQLIRSSVLVLFMPLAALPPLFKREKNQESWFDRFIALTTAENSKVTLTHIASVLKPRREYQRGYIPGNIILNGEKKDVLVKQLLYKNDRAYRLYEKMLYIHTLANQMRGDKARKKHARKELQKAECGELLALDHKEERRLHSMCWRNLLIAEKQTRIPGVFSSSLIDFDFDFDGLNEYLSQRELLNMYLHVRGGKIFELDVFPAHKNYCMSMPLSGGLFVDNLVSEAALEAFKTKGIDPPHVFSDTCYQPVSCNKVKQLLNLRVEGVYEDLAQPVSLRKNYGFLDSGASIQYILKNESPLNLRGYFTVQIDLAAEACDTAAANVLVNVENKKLEVFSSENYSNISWVQVYDTCGKTTFTIDANESPNIFILPVKSMDTVIGYSLYLYWKLDLNPGYETEKMLFFKVEQKKQKKNTKIR